MVASSSQICRYPQVGFSRAHRTKGGGSCGDRRSTGPAVWVGPASADEVAVPAQQRGRLHEEASATGLWEKS